MRELSGAVMDAGTVDTVIQELIGAQLPHVVTTEMVTEAVCAYYHVAEIELKSSNRSKTVTTPRQVAMYLMQALTNAKYDAIASHFYRDRATVIHSIKKIDNAYATDEAFRKQVDTIKANIEAKLAN